MSEDGKIGLRAVHEAQRRRREEAAAAAAAAQSNASPAAARTVSPTHRPDSAAKPSGPLEPLRTSISSRPNTAARLGLGLHSAAGTSLDTQNTEQQSSSSSKQLSPPNNAVSTANSSNNDALIQSQINTWLSQNGQRLIHEWLQINAQKFIQPYVQQYISQLNLNNSNTNTTMMQSSPKLHNDSITSIPSASSSTRPSINMNSSNTGPLSQTSASQYDAASRYEDAFDHAVERDPRAVLAQKYKQQMQQQQAEQQQASQSPQQQYNELDPLRQMKRGSGLRSAGGSKLGLGLGLGNSASSQSGANTMSPGSSVRHYSSNNPAGASSNTSSIISSNASTGSGCDCLLVEDVRVSQRIASAALTRAHYKVDVASDGETAIEKYKQHAQTLKVVLMDIHLPGISGIEATQRIRQYEQSIGISPPCLVYGLTGNVESDNLRLYQSAGMNGCITQIHKMIRTHSITYLCCLFYSID
jgi:CheY-like chemotaxis protein